MTTTELSRALAVAAACGAMLGAAAAVPAVDDSVGGLACATSTAEAHAVLRLKPAGLEASLQLRSQRTLQHAPACLVDPRCHGGGIV